jgi:hypothetical protein
MIVLFLKDTENVKRIESPHYFKKNAVNVENMNINLSDLKGFNNHEDKQEFI